MPTSKERWEEMVGKYEEEPEAEENEYYDHDSTNFDYLARSAMREGRGEVICVWSWDNAPDIFQIRFPHEDNRWVALVPADVWAGWLEMEDIPLWFEALGGYPDELGGGNIEDYPFGEWVVVVGRR